uniref:Uncharacterized protein n=1 Tax=Anguilla anguilla TaxID=7936 RepID=A0A0E9VN73_ANGAN
MNESSAAFLVKALHASLSYLSHTLALGLFYPQAVFFHDLYSVN